MRRGQASASGAALLIVTITVMIVLYLILLPDDAMNNILSGSGGDGSSKRPGGPLPDGFYPGASTNVILSQNIGRIIPPSPNEVEHTIPSFTIFTSTNAMELKRKNSLAVRNGAFSKEPAKLTFAYDETNTKNVMISFNVKKTLGNMIIKLNGEELFNSELESGSPAPIRLPVSLLERMNEITMEAESPGMAFWKTNIHELVNVIISGEVTDRSAARADQHFSISAGEYDAMEFAELRFLPNCDSKFAGRLRISINNQELYSGFADCGVPNKIEMAKELVRAGDNTLMFTSEQGQYLVDLVKVTSKIVGTDVPVFYFNLPPHIHDRLYFNDIWLFITLRFTESRSPKFGVLNVNGFETNFRTDSLVFQTQVDPEFLLPGPNSLMILPQGPYLDIAELRVELG